MKLPIWCTDKPTPTLNQCNRSEAKRSEAYCLKPTRFYRSQKKKKSKMPTLKLFSLCSVLLLFLYKGTNSKCSIYGSGCCYQSIIPLITRIPPPNIDYWPPKCVPLPPKPEYFKSLVLDSNCNITLDPDLSKSFPGLEYISFTVQKCGNFCLKKSAGQNQIC